MPKLSPVSYKKLARVFELDGFRFVREEGDHMVFTKAGVLRPVVIPMYSQVPVFIIKNNLRTAGVTRERYFQLLSQANYSSMPPRCAKHRALRPISRSGKIIWLCQYARRRQETAHRVFEGPRRENFPFNRPVEARSSRDPYPTYPHF
ncbi:MAG: type II toxin-antitoxin system HicA family toxin [Acidobacteriota bacterium]